MLGSHVHGKAPGLIWVDVTELNFSYHNMSME